MVPRRRNFVPSAPLIMRFLHSYTDGEGRRGCDLRTFCRVGASVRCELNIHQKKLAWGAAAVV